MFRRVVFVEILMWFLSIRSDIPDIPNCNQKLAINEKLVKELK
jgi:hypothetical protein